MYVPEFKLCHFSYPYTVLTKSKFPPQNRQNTFFLSMKANFFLHLCIENSDRNRLVKKKISDFYHFGGILDLFLGGNLFILAAVYWKWL